MQILYLLVWCSSTKKNNGEIRVWWNKTKGLIPVKYYIISRNVLLWEISTSSVRSYESEEPEEKTKTGI